MHLSSIMHTGIATIICAFAALAVTSCGQRGSSNQATRTQAPAAAEAAGPAEPVAADTSSVIFFFEEDYVPGEPFRLCEQRLTSQKGTLSAFPEFTENFSSETTPESDVFYFPKADIKNKTLAQVVQLRCNYAHLFNRVLHSYEWFERMSTMPSMDDDEEDDEGEDDDDDDRQATTKKDTLEWIRTVRPQVSKALLDRAILDTDARVMAGMLLNAYDSFDGDDSADSPFSKAMAQYSDALSELPEIVTKEELDQFEKVFWEWYDKEKVVPGIDGIIKIHLHDTDVEMPEDEQLEKMRKAVEAERDIDRRTILALEYAKFDGRGGSILLGEIIESRIYTKYLLEAWISWRANVQMEHSPSSFSVIANNYYDKMKTICLDTMVRHCLQTEDENAECLIENLIFCDIVHRMGSLMGNSSMATLANLDYGEFIHPRLLKD